MRVYRRLKSVPVFFFVMVVVQYWLFDLVNDPYETTNLYYSVEPYIAEARFVSPLYFGKERNT